jgi:sugar phosphate isomerase/epimerase
MPENSRMPLPTISRRSFLGRSTAVAAACLAQPLLAEMSHVGPWQIGCYTRVFDRWDLHTALDAIVEAGYGHAGVMTTKRTPEQEWVLVSANTPLTRATEIGKELSRRNLRVPSLYGHGFEKSESLAAGIDALKRLIDNARACGAKNLLLGGTNAQGDAYDLYYRVVAGACDYAQAQAQGLGISVKPHGGSNATGPQCRKAINKVNHPNFRIWYDPGNTFYYSEGKLDPVDDASTVSDWVVGVCIKDFLPPQNVMVTPGTGRVDFPAVLARLVAGGFRQGPLVVECVNAEGDLKQTISQARQARLYLERVCAGLNRESGR